MITEKEEILMEFDRALNKRATAIFLLQVFMKNYDYLLTGIEQEQVNEIIQKLQGDYDDLEMSEKREILGIYIP